MRNLHVLAITIEEVRQTLINFYVELLKDEEFTMDALKNGCIHFNVKDMPTDKLLNLYAELCLGEKLLLTYHSADLVAYEQPNGDLLFLANKMQTNKQPMPTTHQQLKQDGGLEIINRSMNH